jgi:predicted acylesterase/phospholipase RssA
MPAAPGAGNGAAEPARIGLALAGGGPRGAVYEIGALRALEEALEGVDFNDLHIYVGLSAGGFVCACLANGIPVTELCRAIVDESRDQPFEPGRFFTPATAEIRRRVRSAPGLVWEGVRDLVRDRRNYSLLEPILRLGRALPPGLFESAPIGAYLRRVFTRKGRTDDFRQLGKRLVIVAADLDSGRAVRFGEPGLDHLPISLAVQASSALPGFFAPVEIEGRWYVDGILLKTMHASAALEAGSDLVIAINPIVPADTARAVERGVMRRGMLIDRGLPAVLVQTVRTMVHSRLETGLRAYETKFPGRQVLYVEPRRDDYRMFFTNIFSFSERKEVCEHAYRRTREHLSERRAELGPALAVHGIRLRTEVLDETGRDLWANLAVEVPSPVSAPATVARLGRALDWLEELLPAG